MTDRITLPFKSLTTAVTKKFIQCFVFLDFEFGQMTIDVDHVRLSMSIGSVVNFLALFISDRDIFLKSKSISCSFTDCLDTCEEQMISFYHFFDSFDLINFQTVLLLVIDRFMLQWRSPFFLIKHLFIIVIKLNESIDTNKLTGKNFFYPQMTLR